MSENYGTAVGVHAKTQKDCPWNESRVEFYKALRKIGGSGRAADISKASGGKLTTGSCLHYGYHGVAAGLNKVGKNEGETFYVFTLTAKGKKINLETALKK